MLQIKLEQIIGPGIYFVNAEERVDLELLLLWPACSCTSSGSLSHSVPFVGPSSCPIHNLLSKLCFSIKAETAVYNHYSESIKKNGNITVVLFFCYSYSLDGSLHLKVPSFD